MKFELLLSVLKWRDMGQECGSVTEPLPRMPEALWVQFLALYKIKLDIHLNFTGAAEKALWLWAFAALLETWLCSHPPTILPARNLMSSSELLRYPHVQIPKHRHTSACIIEKETHKFYWAMLSSALQWRKDKKNLLTYSRTHLCFVKCYFGGRQACMRSYFRTKSNFFYKLFKCVCA